jgi:hypothetical protein
LVNQDQYELMRRATAVAVALAIAGCGSATKPPHKTNPEIARAVVAVASTGASEYDVGNGAPTKIAAVKCSSHGYGLLTCNMTFDFTAPDGNRVQKIASVLVTCSAKTCSPEWGSATEIGKTRTLGKDPDSHVAKCDKAVSREITEAFSSNASKKAAAELNVVTACQGVHKGVYTAPVA